MRKLGGLKEPQVATDEIQAYCDQLKSQVEEKVGSTFDVYESKSFRYQVVKGMNYFVKLKSQVEERKGSTFNVYESKLFQYQVVAGMNYFVVVYVGNADYIILKICNKLDNTLELIDVK